MIQSSHGIREFWVFGVCHAAKVCYDSRGQPRNSDCLAWGPGGRDILESTKVIGERHSVFAINGGVCCLDVPGPGS